MSAYVVSEVTSIDPDHIRTYLDLARPSIAAHGGRYLASTTKLEMLEGDDAPQRFVIIEFDDMESARDWYRSAQYAPAIAVRPRALTRRLVLIDGRVD